MSVAGLSLNDYKKTFILFTYLDTFKTDFIYVYLIKQNNINRIQKEVHFQYERYNNHMYTIGKFTGAQRKSGKHSISGCYTVAAQAFLNI